MVEEVIIPVTWQGVRVNRFQPYESYWVSLVESMELVVKDISDQVPSEMVDTTLGGVTLTLVEDTVTRQ